MGYPVAVRAVLVRMAKKVLPGRALDAYRRRRALRRYLRSLSYEIYDRQVKLRVEELEGRVLAHRPDITDGLMKDLLDRTDLVLQQLHRQIEGLRARHGAELEEVRRELDSIRAGLQEARAGRAATDPVHRGEPAPAAPAAD